MKTTLQIATPHGRAGLVPLSEETFQLIGPQRAIDFVREIAPALLDPEVPIAAAGDALARVFYVGATTAEQRPTMVSQEEMQDRTLLDNPIVLFQTKRELDESTDGIMMFEWVTERVFLDDDEGQAWIDQQRHRYPKEEEQRSYRLYAVPAQGALAEVLRNARP